ncbi:hypothetical protein GCG21_00170 [Pseudactinotalea sp. HY160]|uniref:hypothetical protein n=1 Tax=Pseudactinotalea sp. HY160 TaxID=2654490 RepID=UPI00128C1AD8|nr:hypothetical protein [Pseudactinotalea sp. HY160]MPV48448.1 hypothetical protein [Pseudactinotalea sp. HY160]
MNWRRSTGIVISKTGQAVRAAGFLDGAQVLARIESDPEAPDSVLVTVAVDEADRVAILSEDGRRIVPGPAVADLAQAIADDVHGEVGFAEAAGRAEDSEQGAAGPDPFDQHLDVDAAYAPDRAVIFARTGAAGVIDLATAVDQRVYTREHLDGQLVFVADGPALTAVEWPGALRPALVIEQGAAFPALTAVTVDGSAHVHTWDVQVTEVPDVSGDALGGVRAFLDTVIGTGALVGRLMRLFPAAEPLGVRTALDGVDAGPARLLAALGLPADAAAFLVHDRAAGELEQVTPVDPDTLVESLRRAMSGASVTMTETAEAMRQRAEAMRLRAETVFDAAETFTEEVVLPARQSWLTPSLAVAEAVLGALAIRRARRGGALGVISGVLGAVLLTDATVNLAIAASPLLRRGRD